VQPHSLVSAIVVREPSLDRTVTVAPTPLWQLYGNRQRWFFLAVLFLVTVSNYFDYFILSVLLDPIKHEFHLSDTRLGLLGGFSFALCYALTALPIARWADNGNRRTVITVALAGWSVMTAICGFAQSYLQLVLARIGVGIMEPGALPPAQSLIADYFPPDRRATAMAILTQGGSAAGWLVGVVLGGYIAATYGWRMAFLVGGLPGIALAVIARLVLDEPRSRRGGDGPLHETEGLLASVSRLRRKRSFIWAVVGVSVYTTFSYGVGIFLPSFMIRTLHATLEQVSFTWGFAISGANLLGALFGGWLADYLGKTNVRWYVRLPAIACAAGAPIYWLALASSHMWSFIFIDFLAEFVIAAGIPAVFVAVHAVCGNRRRAMATAIVLFSINLFGSGLGPLVAGALSDALNGLYGSDSLRHSLSAMVFFLVPASVAFYWSSRMMNSDLEL
jgi:MFS family permease